MTNLIFERVSAKFKAIIKERGRKEKKNNRNPLNTRV